MDGLGEDVNDDLSTGSSSNLRPLEGVLALSQCCQAGAHGVEAGQHGIRSRDPLLTGPL